MHIDKKSIVSFILPHRSGGVSNIIRNILNYIDHSGSSFHVILIKNTNDPQAYSPETFNADKTILFEYASKENKHHVFKRLCKLIPENALVITNDYFELKAFNNIKRKNTIIHIIHGSESYEYEQIKKYSGIINEIIGVSDYICTYAEKALSGKSIPIAKIFHPIPEVNQKRQQNYNDPLKLIFVGRFKKAKGIFDLPKIDKLLEEKGITVQWTMIGFGPDETEFKDKWAFNTDVNWTGKISNEETIKLYAKNDLFILPSHSEGFPVVLIEAMKCGLIPLVSDLPSGIPEIIESGQNGYRLPVQNPKEYANKIHLLNEDRDLLENLSMNALSTVQNKFNPFDQAKKYKNLIKSIHDKPIKNKTFIKEIFGILKPFIPNIFVKLIRQVLIKSSK